MDKVRVIERSLSCFVAGCLSLVPLIGIVPGIAALLLHDKVRGEVRGNWNPARAYLVCGAILAWFGIVVSVLGVFLKVSKHLS